MEYSSTDIQSITNQALLYPAKARKQFGYNAVPALSKKQKKEANQNAATAKKTKITRGNNKTPAAPVIKPSSVPVTPSGSSSNSVHCVNQAASLMVSQWPVGALPPSGCHPTNGRPCTRQHSMAITAGTPIDKALVTDLLSGVEGFRNAKNFVTNFKNTLNSWR